VRGDAIEQSERAVDVDIDEVIAELDSGLGIDLDVGRLVVGVKGFHMTRLIATALLVIRSV
jgi:hypothetical protein